MSSVSPRDRLSALLAEISRTLPMTHRVLLDAPEFERGATALSALADPSRRRQAIGWLSEEEAVWLHHRLEMRWTRLRRADGAPGATLLAAAEVWTLDEPAAIPVELSVDGLEEGWTAHWPDGAEPAEDGRSATWTLEDTGDVQRLRVRIIGHSISGEGDRSRHILIAEHDARLHRPIGIWHADRSLLVITDVDGVPASGLMVEVDGAAAVTSQLGEVQVTPDPGEVPVPCLGQHRLSVTQTDGGSC